MDSCVFKARSCFMDSCVFLSAKLLYGFLCFFRRESLDELPIAFAPSVFFKARVFSRAAYCISSVRIFRRESLDELPIAFAPYVFFSIHYSYGNFVALCTIFFKFRAKCRTKNPKTYGVKKRTIFSARLPVRGRFVQTLKTGFSFKTTLKNRPILKIQKPKNPFNNSACRDLMFDVQNP